MDYGSKPYRMTPEQLYELKQSEKPRQYMVAILKLPAADRETAYALVPDHLRGLVKELVDDQLTRQRWRKRREADAKA